MSYLKRGLISAPAVLLTFAIGISLTAVWWMIHPRRSYGSIKALELTNNRWSEENAVYAELLRVRHGRDKSASWLIQRQSIVTANQEGFKRGFFFEYEAPDGLATETFDAYEQIDGVRRSLEGLALPHPYITIDEVLVKSFFHTQEGRVAFSREYPNSGGITMVSRVGFNQQMDEALVYAWLYCGGLCGDGGYYLLRKTPSGWRVIDANLWIS